jgi:signal transduction histidine kinase
VQSLTLSDYALANPVRLEQVFVNLLSNAIDAMRDRERRVLAVLQRAGARWHGLSIVGIAQTVPPRLGSGQHSLVPAPFGQIPNDLRDV